MSKRITFIVPAYNAQDYIDRCVTSILRIPYDEIELIVVNDGSNDKTLECLQEIQDPRLVVITQKNQGVSAARNTGIANAHGDYIAFADVDDIVISDVYGKMLNKLSFNKQIYMFAYEVLNGKNTEKITLPLDEGIYDKWQIQELGRRLYDVHFSGNYDSGYFGGKVYQYLISRKFLTDHLIQFQTDMHFAEDCMFCFTCFNAADELEVIAECPYQYVFYEESASHQFRPAFWAELKLSFDKANEICGGRLNHKNEIYFFYGSTVIIKIIEHFPDWKDWKKATSHIRSMVNDTDFSAAIQNLQFRRWTLKESVILKLCRYRLANLLYLVGMINLHIKKIIKRCKK